MSDGAPGDEPFDVLLVEDNPGDARLIEEAFAEGRVGTTLHVASDGVEALEFLRRRGDHPDAPRPDVVLLDLNLPRTDGIEVLAELAEDPELARLPVLVLTGSEAEEDVARTYELGANAYLTKPVDPTEFIGLVRTIERFWLERARLPPDGT